MFGKRRTHSAYSATFGPDNAPSRATSVHSTCRRPAGRKRSTASHRLVCVWRSQPCVARRGVRPSSRRTSNASTTRSGPNSRSQLRHFVGLGDGDAADHDPRYAESQQFLGHDARADAAADLDCIAAGASDDAPDRLAIAL